MNYIKGADRQQIVLYSQTLDNIIDKQNEVRAIDIFVNSLKMSELGFVAEKQVTGRPAYNPADLLKLYIYGYLNRTRSSREIEKETKRNIEVIWLINNLQPDHNTIANFRRDNPEPIRKVFEATVKVAKNRDLIGGKLIAGDSVKLRAQNSKKNNFNKEKLENQIDYLNRKIEEYDKLLESEDTKNEHVKQNVKTNKVSETSKKQETSKKSDIAQNVDVTETSDTSQKNKTNSDITKNVDVTKISEVAQNVDVTETSDTSQKNKNNSEITKNVDVTKISEVAQNVEVTETSDTSQKLETSQKTDIINTVNLEYLKDSKIESKKEYIKTKLQKHEIQRDKYRALLEKLTKTDETQISTSDPDSRNLPIKQQFTEVAYSVQATADAKNKILLDYEVTNKTDKAALSNSVIGAAKALGNNDFVALYDKGYFSAAEIAKCQTLGVTTMVSTPPRPSAAAVPAPDFWGNKFVYNKENDNYLCPNNQILTTNGKVYKSAQGNFKRYQTDRCIPCKLRPKCTTSQCGMRIIDRSEYADNVDINNKLVKENPQLYRLRQEIIEHPFGTMKRQWGFDHTIMKRGKERVSSDIGLIFVAYNLRRLINLLIKDPKTGKFHLNLRGIIKKLVQKILNSFRIELIFA
jgi:transposase